MQVGLSTGIIRLSEVVSQALHQISLRADYLGVSSAVYLLEELVQGLLAFSFLFRYLVYNLIPVFGLPPLGFARGIVVSPPLDFLGEETKTNA